MLGSFSPSSSYSGARNKLSVKICNQTHVLTVNIDYCQVIPIYAKHLILHCHSLFRSWKKWIKGNKTSLCRRERSQQLSAGLKPFKCILFFLHLWPLLWRDMAVSRVLSLWSEYIVIAILKKVILNWWQILLATDCNLK